MIGPGGARVVPADDWYRGYLQSALDEREILRAIRWRPWPRGHGAGFHEYARRHGDFAIAGAAALLDCAADRTIRRAAIVVFGVEPAPRRLPRSEQALVGQKLDDAALAAAAEEARGLDAMSDLHVSAEYRRHIAGVVTGRALADAAQAAEVAA